MAHASDNSKHTSPRRALNVRALIIVLGVLAMFHFGVRHLHGRQVGATCDYLKQTGMAALDAGDHERAFEFLDQYLAFRGGDADVQRLVSELLQEHTTDESLQRAFRMNEQMLLARRDDDDLRLRQVRTAVRLDRFSDAAAHLQELRSRTPDVSEVWYYSGLVAESLEDLDTAAAHFERAIGLPNPAPECFEH
ncbi:MAG: tetratricopeptide repeat protein, partial [Planctomycetaceae bacterium]|nr:tetratricopeptide repeat protein [Planctomycetaceae bacterium]